MNTTNLETRPLAHQGSIKSFGYFGPKYEVGPVLRVLGDGDSMVEIKLLESGEKAEYRLSHIDNDPDAH